MKRKAKSRKAKRRRGLLHHSLDRRRLKWERGDLEKAFADLWEKQNDRGRYSCGTLQQLMVQFNEVGYTTHSAFEIKQRDAVIAATAIQWLGTNCGFAFLVHALRKCNYDVVVRRVKPELLPEEEEGLLSRLIKLRRRRGGD